MNLRFFNCDDNLVTRMQVARNVQEVGKIKEFKLQVSLVQVEKMEPLLIDILEQKFNYQVIISDNNMLEPNVLGQTVAKLWVATNEALQQDMDKVQVGDKPDLINSSEYKKIRQSYGNILENLIKIDRKKVLFIINSDRDSSFDPELAKNLEAAGIVFLDKGRLNKISLANAIKRHFKIVVIKNPGTSTGLILSTTLPGSIVSPSSASSNSSVSPSTASSASFLSPTTPRTSSFLRTTSLKSSGSFGSVPEEPATPVPAPIASEDVLLSANESGEVEALKKVFGKT